MSYNFTRKKWPPSKLRNHIVSNVFTTTLVSEERKFIYTRIGRTASTAIVDSLGLGKGDMEEVSLPYYRKRGTDDWLENITDYEIENDYYKFTFVRNPFERLFSAWNAFNIRKRVVNNFSSFIIDRGPRNLRHEDGSFTNDHWFPQSNYVEYSDGCSFIDYVGKFENLNNDWEEVAGKINGCGDISKRNYYSANYKEFYTERLVDIVSDIYRRDLELFNYGF